jgi:hypothetical protein
MWILIPEVNVDPDPGVKFSVDPKSSRIYLRFGPVNLM